MANAIGLTRFSVVTESRKKGCTATRDTSLEDALHEILAPERLQRRMIILELMPSVPLAEQTDTDFRLKLPFSERIPGYFRPKLEAVRNQFAFLDLVEIGTSEDVRPRCRLLVKNAEPMRSFRLDDDGVGVPHVEDLRSLALSAKEGNLLSNPHGLHLRRRRNHLEVQKKSCTSFAYGMGYFSTEGRTIFDAGSHSDVNIDDIIQGERRRSWIHSIHGDSDDGSLFDPTGNTAVITEANMAYVSTINLSRVNEVLSPTKRSSLCRRIRGMAR